MKLGNFTIKLNFFNFKNLKFIILNPVELNRIEKRSLRWFLKVNKSVQVLIIFGQLSFKKN
jgi:hypothetical protein